MTGSVCLSFNTAAPFNYTVEQKQTLLTLSLHITQNLIREKQVRIFRKIHFVFLELILNFLCTTYFCILLIVYTKTKTLSVNNKTDTLYPLRQTVSIIPIRIPNTV